MDKSWGHYAEQNKPLSKSQVSQAKPNIEYRVALLRDEKNCGGEWCWWSHNSMNILNATELHFTVDKIAYFMLYVFYYSEITGKKIGKL